jgi:phage shock protein A
MFINGETEMFKQIVTLIRGRSYEAGEAVVDAHALPILRQQIRDCADAIAAARKAVAIAIAQNDQEISQSKRIIDRIADLEVRTLAALDQGKTELAQEAAETIAILENERDQSLEAQRRFASEITRLKSIVRNSEARLKDLERGQRLATVTDKTQRLRETGAGSSLNALKDAEATLQRLQVRQREIDVAAIAIAEMEVTNDPSVIAEKMAAAGCGPAAKSRAEDVLKRLSERSKPAT